MRWPSAPSTGDPGGSSPPAGTAGKGLGREDLERDLRERVFRGPTSGGPAGIGLEVELLPVRRASGARVPVDDDEEGPGSRELLARAGSMGGWTVGGGDRGVPSVNAPSGARLSFEPGGQLEYSSPTVPSLDWLLELLREEMHVVRRTFSRAGVDFVARGIDPAPRPTSVALQLETPRYRRMARSFRRFEPAGRLMMRHTASIHVNVDWADDPPQEWEVANRLVPVFTVLFANSPVFGGRHTGFRSYRTVQWVHLDPARSGPARGEGADPVDEYLEFALAAPAFLLGSEDPPYAPLSRWLGTGEVGRSDWLAHLSTLFPEVRPRGYLEFRSVDALPLDWVAVPAVLLRGLLHHPPTRRRVRELLPPASRWSLEEAARRGVRDGGHRKRAERVVALALEGVRELDDPGQGRSIRVAEAFANAFVRRGRDPGDVRADRVLL